MARDQAIQWHPLRFFSRTLPLTPEAARLPQTFQFISICDTIRLWHLTLLTLLKVFFERSHHVSVLLCRLNLPGVATGSSPHACIDLQAIDRGPGILQPTQI
ncbi:hypothetical protein BI343_02315 [Chromobacterium amazonense]|nr:hypothetical protein BI343_02315 [Chromobacterium amazonense]